jgi:signal transduction histidine kinase
MEPDVPFALLAAAQLLAAAVFAGIAALSTVTSRRLSTVAPMLLGGMSIAAAETLTAADVGTSSSDAWGWLRAAGAVLLAVGLLPRPGQAHGSPLAVAPLAAAAPSGWLSLAALLVAAVGIGRHAAWLAGGLVLSGAAAAAATSADHSAAWADTTLALRLLGALLIAVHLGLIVRRSLLTKVVASILAAVGLTAIAATSIVGTTVTQRLGSQQRDRVSQAALAEQADLAQLGRNAQVFATALAAGTSEQTRRLQARALGSLCSGGATFVADVTATRRVTEYPGSSCSGGIAPLNLDDLGRQPPVRAALAVGGGNEQGYVVLEGVRPVVALALVGRPRTARGAPAPRVQVYGLVVDETVLKARKAANGFDATLITLDGRVAASTLPAGAAAAIAADPRSRGPRASPPPEFVARASVSNGSEPTIGYVTLIDGPAPALLLALSAPAEQVTGVERAVLRVLVVAIVVIVGLVALLGLVLGRRIAEPIRRLTDAVERVRAGDLTARTRVDAADEVGVLSRSFDAMTTSLAEADEELRTSAAIEQATRLRLETVLASMTDGLIVATSAGVVTSVNPAAAALVGPDAVGRELGAVVRGAGPDGLPLVGTGTRTSEGMLFRHDAGPVAVACSTAPLADGTGVVVLLRDLGREREVERMKTEFLSNVSHELRTPLTPIQGYSEILARRPDLGPDKVGQYAAVMYDSARRLSRIVDLLVDVASLDAGRVVPEPEEIDLRAFLDARVLAWRTRDPKRAADLRRRAPAGLPRARVDAMWLAKAVDELIDNALKFSEPGQLVTLSAGVDDATGRLRLSVRDAGVGLDAGARDGLLRDFEQGDGSATRARDGLGLGLPFVRRVADVVGVRLVIEGGRGRGSTFSLLVPRADPVPRQRRTTTTRPRRRASGSA